MKARSSSFADKSVSWGGPAMLGTAFDMKRVKLNFVFPVSVLYIFTTGNNTVLLGLVDDTKRSLN